MAKVKNKSWHAYYTIGDGKKIRYLTDIVKAPNEDKARELFYKKNSPRCKLFRMKKQ